MKTISRALLLGSFLLLTACEKPKEADYGKLPFDGTLLRDPDTKQPFSGIARDHHKGGQVSMEVPVKNGKFHGLVREWYPDGTKKSETEFKDGERCGRNTEWNADGSLFMERVYDHDHIVSEKAHSKEK